MVVPFWRYANHQPGGLADRSDVSQPRGTERGDREVEWLGHGGARLMSPSGCYHLHPPRSSSLMTYLLRVWARRDGRASSSTG